MESQHLTPPRPASTPHKDANNLMELLLPSSTINSRPGTPQDFSFPTTQLSNCRQLQHLTTLIKTHANDLEKYKILTNALINKGYSEEDPFLIEIFQRLENSSMKHQQAIPQTTLNSDTLQQMAPHSEPIPATIQPTQTKITPFPTQQQDPTTTVKNKFYKKKELIALFESLLDEDED
ncbi:hypothetical protein TNCV_227151 [Trichonephila clavipes]|nr:hypothetical protein TNCV_227151 [Trichonephila clavipes]